MTDLVGQLYSLPPADRARAFQLARARRHLRCFTSDIGFPGFKWNWHHEILADKLTQVADGQITRLMVFMPPRHGKTELCSKQFPAFLLARDPDVQIISGAYSAEKAREYNRSTQRILDSPPYVEAFPRTRLNGRNVRTLLREQGGAEVSALRNTDEFEIVGRRGFYKSAGIRGGVTGRGAHFVILDDPYKNREEADSPQIRRRVWQEYSASFYSRLENYRGQDARIVLILTRWHEDDLAQQLLLQEPDAWEVVNFPAILDGAPEDGDPRELGEALWPERRSAEQWEVYRKLSPRDFEALGQQRPRRQGGGIFKGASFSWYGGPPPPAVLRARAA